MVMMAHTCGGNCGELISTSAYLSYDSDEPPQTGELRDVTTSCCSREKQLIECDANAQHILWGSIGKHQSHKGNVMEYLGNSNLNILNQSNEPNFVVRSMKDVTDLTVGTNKIGTGK
jgi:hypothetical protein